MNTNTCGDEKPRYREDWVALVRDVLEEKYFGECNRKQAAELAEDIIRAMEKPQ